MANNEFESIKISKRLHMQLKREKSRTKIPLKHLLELAWQEYIKNKEAANGSV